MTFYCQNICGSEDFSIDEWNDAYNHCLENNLSEEKTAEIMEGKECKSQCIDCMAVVGKRRKKTKKLIVSV